MLFSEEARFKLCGEFAPVRVVLKTEASAPHSRLKVKIENGPL